MISRRHALLTVATAPLAVTPMANAAMTSPLASPLAPLRLVTTEFPPYMSATLSDGGTAVAITRAALQRVGMEVQLEYRPWARLMSELQQGVFDGILGAWYSRERENFLAYPRPLGITNRIGFMARRGHSIVVDDLSKLGALKIGTVRDYANPPVFEQAQLQRDEAIDDLTNLRKLLAGRIDLALIDKGVAFHLLQTQMSKAAQSLVWVEPALADMPLYMALSRRDPHADARVSVFNRGLSELHASGDLARLLQRSARWL